MHEPEQPRSSNDGLTNQVTVANPSLELQVFYLKRGAGDTHQQEFQRRQTFQAELQQAATMLRKWLRLNPPQPVDLSGSVPLRRRKVVQRYFSGQWQRDDGSLRAWLLAYEMNDIYLMRIAVEHPGTARPEFFSELERRLPWKPDEQLAELLGRQLFYYAHQLSGSPREVARSVFGITMLRHTTLTCGELYCLAALDTHYLLISNNHEQEALAGNFFDRLAPELGGYICKAVSQEQQYETYLYPQAYAAEQALNEQLEQARAAYETLKRGEQEREADTTLAPHIYAAEAAMFRLRIGLDSVQEILGAIRINVNNYRRSTVASAFLLAAGSDEIFADRQRWLDVLPAQVDSDLEQWRGRLTGAEEQLQVFRRVAFDHNPQALAALVQEHVRRNYPLPSLFKIECTIMFDDLKDSVRYVVKYGDQAWQELMQRHDTLVKPIIAQHRGQVVKGLGDGCLAIFVEAREAVQAALAIQRSVQEQNSILAPEQGLRIRIGLHTGPVIAGADDILGLTVSLAARICGVADEGEIVISEQTCQQAAGVSAGFAAIEPRLLKGLDQPVSLYRYPPDPSGHQPTNL